MQEEYTDKERIRCNNCDLETWHQLLARHHINLPIYTIAGELAEEVRQLWEIFQCLGCDYVSARVTTDYPWETEPNYDFYPERTSEYHERKNYQKLPPNLNKLYIEVVNAFNKDFLLLCTAGLRALLEGLCSDKGITEGPNEQGKMVKSLEGKINGLTAVVPAGIVKNLHGLRFLGNQALHELETPTKEDLELALTILEDILNVVYDLDYRSQVLYHKATGRDKFTGAETEIPF
jgi:hypothetical protein